MENYFEEIFDILVDVVDLDKDEIEGESLLIDDLDLSSLEIMSVVSKIEKNYSIKISEKELLSVATVNDLAKLVASK